MYSSVGRVVKSISVFFSFQSKWPKINTFLIIAMVLWVIHAENAWKSLCLIEMQVQSSLSFSKPLPVCLFSSSLSSPVYKDNTKWLVCFVFLFLFTFFIAYAWEPKRFVIYAWASFTIFDVCRSMFICE